MSRLTRLLWRCFFAGIVLFILLIFTINWGFFGTMPSVQELENPESDFGSQVLAADGTVIGSYYVVNRSPVKFQGISKNVIDALIATEDSRFMEHSGIDGRATFRVIFLLGSRGGGSTITQQLAKNLFPRQHMNILTLPIIKLKEWVMAVKLERNLTKEEILTLYLNTVPFGGNVYGIKNAALTFFSKEPSDLSVDEAAVLVGMLKANTLYNPKRNPKNSLKRRNTVIDQMAKYKYITTAEANSFKNNPIELRYNSITEVSGMAPYFRQVVKQKAMEWCKQNKKPNGEKYDLYKDGLKIYTTLDPTLQHYAEDAVEKHLSSLQSHFSDLSYIKNGSVWDKQIPKETLQRVMESSPRYRFAKDSGLSKSQILAQFKKPIPMTIFTYSNKNHRKDTVMSPLDSIKYMRSFLQTGFMAMDPATGEVKAWVGGIDYSFFQYDHVNITTKRQVGSTIKPLLYCLAVDNGYSPCGMVSTAPQMFAGQKQAYNAGGAKYGQMTMKSALAHSINNASLFLLNQVGIEPFINFAQKCGISSTFDPVPAVALGVTDISLYEMLWAYSMFPEEGINTEPYMITKIEDRNGNLLASFAPRQKEVINRNTAFKMVRMMQGVVDNGTGRRLRFRYNVKGDVAGKTGTTNNQSDAWFIGYTPQLIAGAWVGCDDRFLHFPSEYYGQGASAALPIWALFMKEAESDPKTGLSDTAKFVAPANFQECESIGGDIYQPGPDDVEDGDGGSDNDTGKQNRVPQEQQVPPSEWQ